MMAIEIKVPALPESVSDATIALWHKKVGDSVSSGESLLDLETDKITLEVPAACDGVVSEIIAKEGDVVVSEQLLALVEPGEISNKLDDVKTIKDELIQGPAVRKLLHEHSLHADDIVASGKSGRLTTTDIEQYLQQKFENENNKQANNVIDTGDNSVSVAPSARYQERVPMSRLRQKIAERLLNAQQQAAILTTFNEVDMQPVIDLRSKYKDLFQKQHDTKLGFMSFFVIAAIAALKKFPEVNAAIDGSEIVYNNYFDIGLAVSSPRGLVVPILRDAQDLSMAEIEKQIIHYAAAAREGSLTLEQMTGGTFTITNGGTFGSMLSTPILNPPQSAILGMHNIVKRAHVVNDEIVIRPMMYLALSYDHRIIDGATSVRFLVTIKEMLEDPARLLLNI